MKQNKNVVRLAESQLKAIVAESVMRVLSEKKLENSFKSKEDMTRYRDMYAPENIRNRIDADGNYHSDGTDGGGKWGSGPYRPYIHNDYADEFVSTHINDNHAGIYLSGKDNDEHNKHAAKYNDNLRKRLATKCGQMSYDWDEQQKMNQWDDNNAKGLMNNLSKKRDRDRRQELEKGRFMIKKWVNGERNEADLSDSHEGMDSMRKYHSMRNESRLYKIASESIDRILKNK